MIKSSFKLEKELIEQGYEIVIGVDEAGKGPLAGPVVAAAATLKIYCHSERSEESRGIKKGLNNSGLPRRLTPRNDKLFDLIRDSKMLSQKQRESLYDFIHEHFHVGVGVCDHKTIDRMNISQANFLAMKKALTSLKKNYKNAKCIILIDGNGKIPNFSLEQKAIVGGDKIVKSISAASIVAKVTRDRIMLEMHQKYPEYGFDKHKGYGTRLHMAMLQKHGPSEIHRKSFRPVRKEQ